MDTEAHREKDHMKTEAEMGINVATSQWAPMTVRKRKEKRKKKLNSPSETSEEANPADTLIWSSSCYNWESTFVLC